jgi:glycosyltransferase involved in cell wall biosynthesis
MRLTFLLLSPTFGMHQYTADLANRMLGRYDVHLVTTKGYPADRYGPDVSVHTPVKLSGTGLSLESLRLDRLKRVKQALRALNPDLVHITGPHLWNVELVRWLRRQKIPVVHTIHDLDPHHGASYGRLLHLWNRAIIRSVDHIVVHGEVYLQRLIAGGRNPDGITCTLLTHLFLSYAAREELEQGNLTVSYDPIVLFFGRLEAYKGVDVLLSAFERRSGSRAGAESRQNMQLILAGPGSVSKRWSAAHSSNVEWRNRLIGDQEGLELFSRCSVVVLPYRDATQSALVAAAYYFRKPVIVTNVGALAEYVEHKRTGIVIEGEDVEASLAEAMLRVLMKPGYKESMGNAGRAWYDEQRDRETQEFKRLYARLINQSLSSRGRSG